MHDLWDGWRAVNVLLAILAVVCTLVKFRGRWHQMLLTPGLFFGALALVIWPLGYAVTGVIAILSGDGTGPWTMVMTFPLIYTLASACVPLGWESDVRHP